jgi:flagellar basal-body rod modification protein FlgD
MSNIGGVGNTNNNQQQFRVSTSAANANTGPSMQDFMMLMVAQMQNQDMFSDQDNAAFMSQMSQMASMQAMQDLTSAFMSQMAMNYIGKYVKASAFTHDGEGGDLKPVRAEGYVEMVNFNGGRAMVLIGDTWFNVGDVYEVRPEAPVEAPKAPNTGTEANNEANNNTETDPAENPNAAAVPEPEAGS